MTGTHGSEGAPAGKPAGATRLGDQRGGGLPAQAGDLIQPVRSWQHGGTAGPPGLGPGNAVRVHAPGRGDRGQVRGDRLVQVPELGVQEVDGPQQGRGGVRVLRTEPHAGQRLGERGELVVAHLAPAQGGEDPRVALPGDHRLDDRAGGLVPGQLRHDGRQLAQGVLVR